MFIHEAVKEAMAKGLAITRRPKYISNSFAMDCASLWKITAIVPTNTRDCCFIGYADDLGIDGELLPVGRRWNPLAEDLLADDWVVTDYMRSADLMKVIR